MCERKKDHNTTQSISSIYLHTITILQLLCVVSVSVAEELSLPKPRRLTFRPIRRINDQSAATVPVAPASVLATKIDEPTLSQFFIDNKKQPNTLGSRYVTSQSQLNGYAIKQVDKTWKELEQHIHCYLTVSQPQYFEQDRSLQANVESKLSIETNSKASSPVVVYCSNGLNTKKDPPSIQATYAGPMFRFTRCYHWPLNPPSWSDTSPISPNWLCVASIVDPLSFENAPAPRLQPPTLEFPEWERVVNDVQVGTSFIGIGPNYRFVAVKVTAGNLAPYQGEECYLANLSWLTTKNTESDTINRLTSPSISFQIRTDTEFVAVICKPKSLSSDASVEPAIPPSILAVGGGPGRTSTSCRALAITDENHVLQTGWACLPTAGRNTAAASSSQ